MIGLMDAQQPGGLHVRVDLGGVDGRVAKQNLNGAQIGAAFQQMCGEGMPEGVR